VRSAGLGGHLGERSDGEDAAVGNEDGVSGLRPFGKEDLVGNEQGRGLVERAQLGHGFLHTRQG
jgi:hypothetical protein